MVTKANQNWDFSFIIRRFRDNGARSPWKPWTPLSVTYISTKNTCYNYFKCCTQIVTLDIEPIAKYMLAIHVCTCVNYSLYVHTARLSWWFPLQYLKAVLLTVILGFWWIPGKNTRQKNNIFYDMALTKPSSFIYQNAPMETYGWLVPL